MSASTEQLLGAVLTLPEEDRLELAEALIASLQPSNRPPIDESWRDLIRRRSEELRSGAVKGVPWEEVKRRAREKAGG